MVYAILYGKRLEMMYHFSRDMLKLDGIDAVQQIKDLRTQPALSIVKDQPVRFVPPYFYMKDSKIDPEDVERMLNHFMQSDDPLIKQYQDSRRYQEYWTEYGEIVQLSPRALAIYRPRLEKPVQKAEHRVRAKRANQNRATENPEPKKVEFSELSEEYRLELEETMLRMEEEKQQEMDRKKMQTHAELRSQKNQLKQGYLQREVYFNPPELPARANRISQAKSKEYSPNSLRYAYYMINRGKDDYLEGRTVGAQSARLPRPRASAGQYGTPSLAANPASNTSQGPSFPSQEEAIGNIFQSASSVSGPSARYHCENIVFEGQNPAEESDYEDLAWNGASC